MGIYGIPLHNHKITNYWYADSLFHIFYDCQLT